MPFTDPIDPYAPALRRSLVRLAAWTNLIFDGGAGRRLIDLPLPPDGLVGANTDTDSYKEPGSAGPRIEQSVVFRTATRAEHCVRTGEWPGTLDELRSAQRTLAPFMHLLDVPLVDPYEMPILLEEDETVLRQALRAFDARVELLFRGWLSFKELAALSGLSEKTVRMAATGRDHNPELATYKEGATTRVAAKEAERWLRTRASYRPTRILNRTEALDPEPANALQLATLLKDLRTRVGLSISEVIALIGLASEANADLDALEQAWWTPDQVNVALFDLPVLTRLAQVLQVSEPAKFVRAVAALLLPYQIERQFAATTQSTERTS